MEIREIGQTYSITRQKQWKCQNVHVSAFEVSPLLREHWWTKTQINKAQVKVQVHNTNTSLSYINFPNNTSQQPSSVAVDTTSRLLTIAYWLLFKSHQNMGKPLSDQIINHPAIHKTSNLKKSSVIRFLAGWLAGSQLWPARALCCVIPAREGAVEVISCQFVF